MKAPLDIVKQEGCLCTVPRPLGVAGPGCGKGWRSGNTGWGAVGEPRAQERPRLLIGLGTRQLPSSTPSKRAFSKETFSKEKGEEGKHKNKHTKIQSSPYTLELKWEHGLTFLFAIQSKISPICVFRRIQGTKAVPVRAAGQRSRGFSGCSAGGKPNGCDLSGGSGSLLQGWWLIHSPPNSSPAPLSQYYLLHAVRIKNIDD